MRSAWPFLFIFFSGCLQTEVPKENKDLSPRFGELLSQDAALREKEARRFKELLGKAPGENRAGAEEILARLPAFPSGVRIELRGQLALGGPWMPGVLNALNRGGKTAREAASILRTSLEHRALKKIPPPRFGTFRLFGESVGFDFRGTWPGSVPLDLFLDRVNAHADPVYPFVLSPELGREASLKMALTEPPPSGPAPMVVDFVLMERGLGVMLLESVALVTRDGKACSKLSSEDQEYDAFLLDKIIRSCSGTGSRSRERRTAVRALAHLDIPGFFEGYFLRFLCGDRTASLDYLLAGRNKARLAARLGAEEDAASALLFFDAWLKEKPGFRKEALFELILQIDPDLRDGVLDNMPAAAGPAGVLFRSIREESGSVADILALVEKGSGEGLRTGLIAAHHVLIRSERVREALIARILKGDFPDQAAAALMDRCLVRMGRILGDDGIAPLLTADRAVIQKGIFETAERFGGEKCLDAIVALLGRKGAETSDALRALLGICERLGIDPEMIIGDESKLTEISRAGLILAAGRDKKIRRPAADVLVGRMRKKSGDDGVCLDMLSLENRGRIADYLEPWLRECRGRGELIPPQARKAVIRSAVISSRFDPTASARIVLTLNEILGTNMDPQLDQALKTVSDTFQVGSWRIEMRFF